MIPKNTKDKTSYTNNNNNPRYRYRKRIKKKKGKTAPRTSIHHHPSHHIYRRIHNIGTVHAWYIKK